MGQISNKHLIPITPDDQGKTITFLANGNVNVGVITWVTNDKKTITILSNNQLVDYTTNKNNSTLPVLHSYFLDPPNVPIAGIGVGMVGKRKSRRRIRRHSRRSKRTHKKTRRYIRR